MVDEPHEVERHRPVRSGGCSAASDGTQQYSGAGAGRRSFQEMSVLLDVAPNRTHVHNPVLVTSTTCTTATPSPAPCDDVAFGREALSIGRGTAVGPRELCPILGVEVGTEITAIVLMTSSGSAVVLADRGTAPSGGWRIGSDSAGQFVERGGNALSKSWRCASCKRMRHQRPHLATTLQLTPPQLGTSRGRRGEGVDGVHGGISSMVTARSTGSASASISPGQRTPRNRS